MKTTDKINNLKQSIIDVSIKKHIESLHILLVGGNTLAAEELNKLTHRNINPKTTVFANEVSEDMQILLEQHPNVDIILKYNENILNDIDYLVIAQQISDLDFLLAKAIDNDILIHNLQDPINSDFIIEFDGRENLNQKPIIYKETGEQKWKRIAYLSIFGFLGILILNILSFYLSWSDIEIAYHFLNNNTDERFFWLLIVGFIAQMIDGALGMGYGVTSTAALLYLGIPLPAISSSIHTAEMFSSGVSGLSHYKFGNINKKLLKNILIPGILGAIIGAALLAYFGENYAKIIKPVLAIYTLFLGIKIFLNAFKRIKERKKIKHVGWLAASGGFLDSFGGGGWGPLVTSTLIAKGKTPRYVIGTVSLTEFFVTMASAITFFMVIGITHWQLILGLIIGGVIAAPIAAKLAGKLPLKYMFVGVGSLIIIWSLNVFLKTLGWY